MLSSTNELGVAKRVSGAETVEGVENGRDEIKDITGTRSCGAM